MNTLPRRKILACYIGLALAAMASPQAFADSAYGVDTANGNFLNTGYDGGERDIEALPSKHTPTGQLYGVPNIVDETVSGTKGMVEIGALSSGANNNAALFRKYKDPKGGLYLNRFGVEVENEENARYFTVEGGGVGRDDQFYGFTAGRYNDWKVKAFYSETPHVFTTTYRNLWSGTGTGRLTLNTLPASPALVVAGTNYNATCTATGTGAGFATTCYTSPTMGVATASTAASIQGLVDTAIGNAALATPYSELSIVRKKGGVRADMTLSETVKVFAGISNEKRQGARPFGLVMGGGGGTGGVEMPETIDYNTRDLMAGMLYADELNTANIVATASLFRNNVGTMTVDNPMTLAPANGIASFPQAVFDLYPNNDYYNVKGEYARELPDLMKGRFTSMVSYSQSKQNDDLIPSTPYAGASVNTVAGGSWDTVDSLSQKSANLKVTIKLAEFGLSLKPVDDLDVKGKVRYYQTSTNSNYWACNPLTGQWGRLINSGSGAAMLNTPTIAAATLAAGCNAAGAAAAEAVGAVPSAGNVNIRSVPYAYKQVNTVLGADYRLNRVSSVNVNFDHEVFDREHREIAKTKENKLKLGYVNRGIEDGTLRLSYEADKRSGSPYVGNPYEAFYSESLGPLPSAAATNVTSWIHINSLHRKFDLADRDQNILNGRFNYMLTPELDLGMSAQLKRIKYPDAETGRSKQDQDSLTVDMTWQPSPEMTLTGFVTHQTGKMEQRGLSQNACVIGNTYYLWSDGSMTTTATPTAAQTAAGVTLVGNSGAVTGANFETLCGTAAATSPLYPTSRTWSVTQKDTSDVLGLGFQFVFTKATLDMDYTYSNSRTAVAYTYNPYALALLTSGAPTATQLATFALIGSGFPSDLTLKQNVLDVSVLVPINKSSSVRVLGRGEYGTIQDWHYAGVAANPAPAANQQTYLDAGAQNYSAYMLGLMYQYKM